MYSGEIAYVLSCLRLNRSRLKSRTYRDMLFVVVRQTYFSHEITIHKYGYS